MPIPDRPYILRKKKGKKDTISLTKDQFDKYNEKGLIGYKGIYTLESEPELSKPAKEIKEENEKKIEEKVPEEKTPEVPKEKENKKKSTKKETKSPKE